MFPLPITTEQSIGRLVLRLSGFVQGRLWLQVLVAMAIGIATGMAIGPTGGWLTPKMALLVSNWLAMPGYLFLAMVQMIVIPLVVASIILGMTSSRDMQQLRSMGLRTGLFFLFTTLVAAVIGLVIALAVQPGSYLQVDQLPSATAVTASATSAAPSLATLPSQIVRIVPTNPLQASVEQNMLQVVVFAIFMGVALVTMDGKLAKPLVDLLGAVQEVSMVVVRWAMYLVPLAVFGLMTQLTARMGLDALLGMGVYVLTVLTVLGALLLTFAFLMVVYAVGRRRSPLTFLRGSRDVLLLAFSTSSSAAVMPLTIRTAEEALGVQQGVSRFVIPLGTTINMAGTALYQVIATLFLAQVYQVDVGLPGLLLVVVLAVGASIGSPGTPGVVIVILSMMLGTVGIPAEGIALIIGVDRILDMSRTTLNVAGDLVAASVIDEHTLRVPEEVGRQA
ncbi:dicarboxylate/amino acid:cation symporter [Rhodoferax sp. PAMC 29310]|uniref:dicarboxylate/amino acid:cation symporter n=1 Tax=Rhodoferax sp. PAMC 29310 TaxID=2822760 RepID=UPI001B32AD66|nr:dicarboxylate/amino acid:cation symporter [Rhodoferax sp. PAMC 29310]